LCLSLAALPLVGCGGQRHAAPVNPEQARESLRTVLESWKKGEGPDQLRQGVPSITVQDIDWQTGYKLLDYQIIGDGKYDDANLRCPVKLTLKDPQGHQVQKQVTYMVGTNPSITVFREIPL
jgi:hypothetical protein